MPTIATLKARGFDIRQSLDAAGCMEVLYPQPFWLYNPNFYSEPSAVAAALEAASSIVEKGRHLFSITVAGLYEDEHELPFAILMAPAKQVLDDRLTRLAEIEAQMQAAQQNLETTCREFYETLGFPS